MELSECPEPGQGEKYPDSFPNEICMGEFPTGRPVGFAALCFSITQLHINNIVQLQAPTRRTETPQACPQEADNSVDMRVATEEVASVITNKQSAEVHSLGGCQTKFGIKLFNLSAFVLLLSGDVSLASCYLKLACGGLSPFPLQINTGSYLENMELITANPVFI